MPVLHVGIVGQINLLPLMSRHPGVGGHVGNRVLDCQVRDLGQTPVENAVAYLELSKLDRQLALTTENQRLQALGDRNDRDRIAALNRRLAAEADENARLKKALDEARAKLDAIADIERQSTQRKPTTTQGRSP